MVDARREVAMPSGDAGQSNARPSSTVKVVKTESRLEFGRGPLPPPEILAGYENTLPGAADRILSMAERQQQHRMSLERCVIESDQRRSTAGLICGTVICLVFGIGAIFLIYTGHNITGLIALLTPLASLVGAFFYAQRTRQAELAQKTKDASTSSSELAQGSQPVSRQKQGRKRR